MIIPGMCLAVTRRSLHHHVFQRKEKANFIERFFLLRFFLRGGGGGGLSKMVYKRVRGWTSGLSFPV